MNSAAVDLPSFRSARGERNEPPGTATTAFSDSKFSIQSLKLLRPIDANVAKLMLDNHISGVPVVDESASSWGSSRKAISCDALSSRPGRRPWWLTLTSSPEKQAAA
jgi:hypothetical protein